MDIDLEMKAENIDDEQPKVKLEVFDPEFDIMYSSNIGAVGPIGTSSLNPSPEDVEHHCEEAVMESYMTNFDSNHEFKVKLEGGDADLTSKSTSDNALSCAGNRLDLISKIKSDVDKQMDLKIKSEGSDNSNNNIFIECANNLVKNYESKDEIRPECDVKTHTGEKPKKCDVCGKYLSSASSMAKHKKTHTGEKSHICDTCGKCFRQAGTLQSHKRTHTGEKPYKCDVCGKCFSTSSQLPKHKTVHTGEQPYKCAICGKCFRHAYSMSVHIQRFHNEGEKRHKCEVCGKLYNHPSSLSAHKNKIHRAVVSRECTVCGKCFKDAGHLSDHMNTHTGEKPYSCKICGKCFAGSSNLSSHRRTHSDIKPYKCTLCDKAYKAYSNLSKHMKKTHMEKH